MNPFFLVPIEEAPVKKLSLDDLTVDSFATGEGRTPARGTVRAHVRPTPDTSLLTGGACTFDPAQCGDTRYVNCTFECSADTGCQDICWVPA